LTVSYPFVDLSSGGNFDGYITVADKVLGMVDESYKIIPGHGALSVKADRKGWRDMLATIRARVKKQVDGGKALDAIQKLTAEWDEKWGKAFIKPDRGRMAQWPDVKRRCGERPEVGWRGGRM